MSFATARSNQTPSDNGNQDINAQWDSVLNRTLQSLTTLSSEKSQVEMMLAKVGTPEDSLEYRGRIRGKLQYIQNSTPKTAEELKTLKRINSETKDTSLRSQRKVTVSKLEKDLSNFQQAANKVSREWAVKEKIPVPQNQSDFPSQNRYYEEDDSNERQALLADTKQLFLLEKQIDTQDILISQREEDLDQIHGKMVDVNDIMKDLNHLVVEQAPLVDNIQRHVEHARVDIESGVKEVEKAGNYQKKANSKTKYIVCILIIVMAVLVLLVILGVLLS